MADRVLLKPWELHGEGREFEGVSNDFARAALDLENGLAALGTPWGRDEPGQGFGSAYEGAREGVLAGLHGLADRLGGIGTGLHTMADNAEHNDQDNRDAFRAIEPGTGTAPASL
ncbi:WXG100 family type VII secretion target [Kitasatospora sp. NPDC059571]|uniref:WXG100 family type VII secretion target n=1 Tax=Kitasatospora sp. NPDC059571 TaxID=3346871 RepID=UPI00369EE149